MITFCSFLRLPRPHEIAIVLACRAELTMLVPNSLYCNYAKSQRIFQVFWRQKQGFAKVFCRFRRREERGDEDAGHPHPAGDWPSPSPLLLSIFAKPCHKKERHTNVALFFCICTYINFLRSVFSGGNRMSRSARVMD